MSNQVEKVNGVAFTDIETINGKTDSDIEALNGRTAVGQAEFMTATGGTITTDGDYKVHTFNSSGTFTPTTGANATYGAKVWYVMVAGGGGGGGTGGSGAGGGGAGGYRNNSSYNLTVSDQGYSIVIGAGGAKGYALGNNTSQGGDGGDTTAFGLTCDGGGGGGTRDGYNPAPSVQGRAGGSSGGAGQHETSTRRTYCGNAYRYDYGGNTPASLAVTGNGTGNIGGAAASKPGQWQSCGGGGGAGAAGDFWQNCASTNSGARGGNGGDGLASSITGSSVYLAGGGAGGWRWSASVGSAGQGGGGASSTSYPNYGTNGTANTGGGGGAGGHQYGNYGGDGGSGVVIIRYKFQ